MIAQRLADFAHGPLPTGDAGFVLRLSLLDWCAVGVAGRDEPVAKILRDQALEEGGAGQAGVIGSATQVPVRAAALVNGAISHALDYDDTHFAHIGHPSVAVIPAALAAAQLAESTGEAMQQAALIGAEASVRMGLWLGRAHYQAGFHQTATAGAFGACLAACRLLGTSKAETMMALGLITTRASGLKSQFGTMGKPLNAGLAASNGIEAALLARRGFISRADAIEASQGFGATHHGSADPAAWEGLGEVWQFERVSHKFHACCHGLHATLEALSPLIGAEPSSIRQIRIATHPRWLSVCNNPAPKTGLEAKFSYRMTAAMRVLGAETSLPASYSDDLCADPNITALMAKVEVVADDRLSEMQARVGIGMSDGTMRDLFHDLDAPLALSAREERVRAKAAALLGPARADRLWRLICEAASPGELAAELTT